MKKILIALVVILALGAGCSKNNNLPPSDNASQENNSGQTIDIPKGTSTPVVIDPAKVVTPEKPALIGGQKDGYGCLGPAGYSRDDELKVCARSWEIKDANIRRAIKLAVDSYKPTYSLTVVEVKVNTGDGNYAVTLEAYGEKTTVNIANWEVKL